MADTQINSALRRKARPLPRSHGGGAREVAAGIRAQLLRSARNLPGLTLEIGALSVAEALPDDVLGGADDGTVLLRIDAAAGRTGVALLAPDLVQGLIEVQTTGDVASRSMPRRPVTAIDRALVARALDPWIADLSHHPELAAFAGAPRISGVFDDPRAAGLDLTDDVMSVLHATLDFNAGRRSGRMTFAMPQPAPAGARAEGVGRHDFAPVLQALSAELEVVLCSVRMPLGVARALEVGQEIVLASADVRKALVRSPGGDIVARAHLGQSRGMRAVRMQAGDDGDHAPSPPREGAEPEPAALQDPG